MTRLRGWARLLRSGAARADARSELRRRLRGRPPLPAGDLNRVIVICHGNICRSPFAASLLAERLVEVEVRSAGLAATEGEPAHPDAIEAATRLGVALGQHRTHRLVENDVTWADLVLVMEGSQLDAVNRDWPAAGPRLRLLGDYLPGPPHRIIDPWGQPAQVFDAVFERIQLAVDQLATELRRGDA